MDRHKNFAYSTVATAPSPATTGTSLVVASGDGALFPVPPFNVTVWPADEAPTIDNAEILRVTGVSTDTLTIDREEEGTSARTVVVGDQIAATITSKTLEDAEKTSTKLITQTAHGLSVGEWVRLDSSGDYILAQADSAVNSEVVGVVVVVFDANNFTVQRSGYVTVGLSGLTAGDVYYLDPDTPGDITNTNPTTDGDVSKPVLIAESATTGWMTAEMRGVIVPGAGDPVTAAEVSIADAGGDFTATDVEGALAELQADHETDAQNLADHIADATDAHDASAISIVDAGNDFTATEVEGALAELQADHESDAQALTDHISDSSDAHDASAISVVSTTLSGTGTDAQAVFEEIDNLLDDHSARHEDGGADEISIQGLSGTPTTLQTHLDDTSDAHDASAISVDSTTLVGTGTDVQAVFEELDNAIADHLADSSDAHDASAISIVDAGNDFTATDVEGALAELQSDAEADVTALSDHISDTADAHDASAISADSTTLVGTGTDVQAVLEELDNAIADHLADTSDAHDASAISIADAGNDFTATDVEGALDELQADHEADATALSDHISDSSAAHAASAVSVSSATLSGTGTDVQAVFEEIDNLLDDHSARHENGGADEISIAGLDGTPVELTNHLNDSADAHDASAISVADSGGHFDATEVEAALTELAVAARIGRFFLSAAGMWPSTTSGAAANAKTEYGTNDVDMYGLAFDQTTQEFAQGTIAMPSDWDGGTITAQFYWTKTGTSTNSVVWGCAGRSYGDNEAIDQAFGTAQEATDAGQSATDMNHISSATPAITLAGTPAAGELVQFRVYRDPNNGSDTLATDAILLGVMIAYNRNI